MLEMLVMPRTGDSRDAHSIGNLAKRRSQNESQAMYLGISTEPTPQIPKIECDLVTAVNATEKANNTVILKQDKIETKRLGKSMTEINTTTQKHYFQVFQPEPNLTDYGKPPSHLNNSQLGLIASHVHGMINNHLAKELVLNSAQFVTLLHRVQNTTKDYKIVYIINTDLPKLGAGKNQLEVSLPTVCLSDDG